MSEKKFEKLEKKVAKLNEEEIEIPEVLPAIAMRSNVVVYPNTVVPFYVGREKSLYALEDSMENYNQLLFVVNQKDPKIEAPKEFDLFKVGTVVKIMQIGKLPDGTFKVLVEGISRAQWTKSVEGKYFKFQLKLLKSRYRKTKRLLALMRVVRDEMQKYIQYSRKLPTEALMFLEDMEDPDVFADLAASICPGTLEEKQQLLEILHPAERLEKILKLISKETELLEIEHQLDQKVKQRIEKSQKEYFLREKLRVIREELGGEEDAEIKELEEKIENGDLPKYVKEKARFELRRLEKMSPYSPEANVIRNYLDWILNLPWNVKTEEINDLSVARKVLEKHHFGLEEPKQRILEFLATRSVSKTMKAPIICFVGPPGVGKTSLGRSIAEALGRKFLRMSLGGLRDEAEIRGHRRTYVGALPGRIIQLIRKAGVKNPVLLLDEIDKMGISFQGDPASALLEVLDPEQNKDFVDLYLELPFDLSQVLFITTANTLYNIPEPLKDRMEIIEIPSYTNLEKFHIAKDYIIPRIFDELNFEKKKIIFRSDSIKKIISEYTLEPGVRELERKIRSIVRKSILEISEGKEKVIVTPKKVKEYIGPPRIKDENQLDAPTIGVSTGLAWAAYGGTTLFIESTFFPGKGRLILTGKLGDVMKESAQISFSLTKKICGEEYSEFFERNDLHIHVPEGAVPKDGPSAGITIVTSLVSSVKKIPVDNNIAMSGEITLRGRVLPVGGIKEKVLAAYRKGIKKIILPYLNRYDIEKIPDEVRKNIEFVFVNDIYEVLKEALVCEDKECGISKNNL
ncbi:DNA-binding protein [Thermosipho melanesiensis]|uniref:Lon protease n=2 Tax=Thermosipho melanesiensis TaxID=46541 RepID=A6LN37_THEM4|nr:endopeptidase La [Thermosipho melanesiensis]ABR31338.1 ATP-dependent protease La [Thermosipho melanesiensis BI429]APT74398.1 DNA-binding protein [Thermosipho melanesiensis]OOC36361.1 DNA-binding protein [Thermosipho melanesiensis]OOC37179.1 DNA-binding protein [Thermosipho melanesiensis]OOC37931.1 DNA-binding protein [Thermosipho melanesiensis]